MTSLDPRLADLSLLRLAGLRVKTRHFWPAADRQGSLDRLLREASREAELAQVVITPPYALLALATFPLPRMLRYRIISGWSRLVVWLARVLLGIQWRVEGLEHLPTRPAVGARF